MIEEINELLRRDPFIPFRIVLTSGQEHDVVYPNLVAVGQTTIHICAPRTDRYTILRQNQIASVDVLAPAA